MVWEKTLESARAVSAADLPVNSVARHGRKPLPVIGCKIARPHHAAERKIAHQIEHREPRVVQARGGHMILDVDRTVAGNARALAHEGGAVRWRHVMHHVAKGDAIKG